MADSGVAVVAPMPSQQQQQPVDQDKMVPVIADGEAISRSTVLPPMPPASLPMNKSDDHQSPIAPIEVSSRARGDTLQYQETLNSNPINIKKELNCVEAPEPLQPFVTSGCSSGSYTEGDGKRSTNDETKPTVADQAAKRKRKIDEVIIDGFAISAFKSWEELQDEMNEQIASDLLKKRAAERERPANNEALVKKKSKSRSKSSSKSSQSSSGCNSGSMSEQPKVDKSKKVKRDLPSTIRRGPNGKFLKNDEPESSSKKSSSADRSKENANEGTSLGSHSSHASKKFKEDTQRASNDSNKHDIPSRSVDSNQDCSPHASQSPQVYRNRNHHERAPSDETLHSRLPPQPQNPQRILAQDLLRDPHASVRPQSSAQYSPYGNNPHLNHLYNVTSNIQHSMQSPPFFNQQSSAKLSSDSQTRPTQQHSQSQQPSQKQNAPSSMPPLQSQSPHPSQSHAYPQSGQSHPSLHHSQGHHPAMGGMNQSHPFYHPMHMSAQNPFLYQSHQHGSASQNNGPTPNINPQSQSAPQNPYAQQSPGPQYHSYLPPGLHHSPLMQHPPPPPFGMYPPHMPSQPQPQTSSMMASMSMSQLPNPFGTPYIVNETTISRQTSIIPPSMPSMLDHAAASAAASRFGHHPMLPPMSSYNPAAAAAAAAAVAQHSHHGHQSNPGALYPTGSGSSSTLSNAERSFMDLARSYNAASAAAAAASAGASAPGSGPPQLPTNYPSLMAPPAAYPAPPASTANSYGLDRWPTKMAFEHHQRTMSRYSSLYPTPGGYPSRPPGFPTSLFPPPF